MKMPLALRLYALLGLELIASNPASAKDLGWRPETTRVFVVGALSWKHKEMFGSFPVKNRRDAALVDFFRQAGVPDSQMSYLQDKQATQEQIKNAFIAELKKLKAGDLFVLYYCGHGYKSKKGDDVYLASYDAGDKGTPGWSVNSISETIKDNSQGARVLWLIDCCHSGQAARAMSKQAGGPPTACVTSSSASESSTEHWTFTEALLDALHGAAYVDLNNDGSITLAELAAHAEIDMALAEEQLSTFATTGGFDSGMVLAHAQSRGDPRVGERVKVEADGAWYPTRIVEIRDAKFRVHFIGYEDDEDIWVTSEKLKPIKPVQYEVGADVEVLWQKKWYPARILKVKYGVHFIHYTDYDSNWDEWVASKRIRAHGSRQ